MCYPAELVGYKVRELLEDKIRELWGPKFGVKTDLKPNKLEKQWKNDRLKLDWVTLELKEFQLQLAFVNSMLDSLNQCLFFEVYLYFKTLKT